jgi:alpha-beta hydrolase superfamily lysophospholipase
MQWGTEDRFVNEKEIESVYEAVGTDKKKLVVYQGAEHESLLRKDPVKWREEINLFLQSRYR